MQNKYKEIRRKCTNYLRHEVKQHQRKAFMHEKKLIGERFTI